MNNLVSKYCIKIMYKNYKPLHAQKLYRFENQNNARYGNSFYSKMRLCSWIIRMMSGKNAQSVEM